MTIFGPDISNWQAGLDLARVRDEGFDFVFCKVTEGSNYVDPTWPGFRDAAHANGLLLAGYHYVRADHDVDAQADLFVNNLGGDIPVMLDHEANSGGIGTFWAVVNAINARGHEVALSYIPRWYWSGTMGSPDLSAVPGLIQSAYVSGSGDYASAMYPGDDAAGWSPFGGATPALLQFTDSAAIAGQNIDANAYRGTRDQLAALLDNRTAPPPPVPTPSEDDDMTPEQNAMLSEIHRELTQLYPSRSRYRDSDGVVDTLAGIVLNVDGRVHEKSVEADALRGVQAAVSIVRRAAAAGDEEAAAVIAAIDAGS